MQLSVMDKVMRLTLAVVLLCAIASAQTGPVANGPLAQRPATCTIGQIYFATDATAGQNLYYCTGVNTWTQQSGGSGGGGAVSSVFGQTGVVPNLTGDVTTNGSSATTLATVNSAPGACGDASHTCQVTTNAKGLVTAQSPVAITGGSGAIGGVNAQTAAYTAATSDAGKLITMNGTNLTLTLPSTPPSATWTVWVEDLNASALTVTAGTATINGSTASLSVTKNQSVQIYTDGTNYFSVAANSNFPNGVTTGSNAPAITAGTSGVIAAVEGTAPTGCVAGVDCFYADSATHGMLASNNGGSMFAVASVKSSGTVALGTTAITAGACGTTVTAPANAAAAGDAINWSYAVTPVGTGYDTGLVIRQWATTGQVNFVACNPTAASITPGAMSLTWHIPVFPVYVPPQVTYVNHGTASCPNSSTTCTAATINISQAGDAGIVTIGWCPTASCTTALPGCTVTLSDANGSYTPVTQGTLNGTGWNWRMFYFPNAAAGSRTLTAIISGTSCTFQYAGINWIDFQNANRTNPIDTNLVVAAQGTGPGTETIVSPGAAQYAGEQVLAFYAGGTPAFQSPFTTAYSANYAYLNSPTLGSGVTATVVQTGGTTFNDFMVGVRP